MNSTSRIGIIDIGSNSIRLVIYERNALGGHRVVSEHKESARLSERIGSDGMLHRDDIASIVPLLRHFAQLCQAHDAQIVRAAATAAIRNAANSADIVAALERETGLRIEVLSGEEEARFGFLGVINSLDISDGFIVDIGGGSTEVTLFRGRQLLRSYSFPFGSVNTTRQFMKNGAIGDQELSEIKRMVQSAMADHPWMTGSPGLPLVGLGGTIRTLGKMSQKRHKYSLPLAHNYPVQAAELEHFLKLLPALPLEKRKKVEGLSKDRADIIPAGLMILHAVYEAVGASHCLISGSGLRDGLFSETVRPEQPQVEDVLGDSVHNLLMLHPNAALSHVRQVNRLALALFDRLAPAFGLDSRHRACLYAASLLYRIGASVHYYQYPKHTQYMIAQARLHGLTHREIVLCSFIAAYKPKGRLHQKMLVYKDILQEADEALILQLGSLLQLATAFDRSETQPVERLDAALAAKEKALDIKLSCKRTPLLELRELDGLAKDFQKNWGLKLRIQAEASSTT